ncbi:MAG: hypothetical protein WC348_01300 [Patescibacteria group bacterium]|jgi:hypothetical protein
MAEETKNAEHGALLSGWKIPEYTKHDRGRNWYLWAGIAFVLLLAYAIYTLDFLFAVILILGAVIIFIRSREEPMEIDFNIFEKGIGVGGKFHSWKDIASFYIIYEPPEVKNLYFNLKGLRSRLSVPLLNINPLKTREILLKYLIENLDEEREPLSEEYGRFLKI